jgi:hypothetical protein
MILPCHTCTPVLPVPVPVPSVLLLRGTRSISRSGRHVGAATHRQRHSPLPGVAGDADHPAATARRCSGSSGARGLGRRRRRRGRGGIIERESGRAVQHQGQEPRSARRCCSGGGRRGGGRRGGAGCMAGCRAAPLHGGRREAVPHDQQPSLAAHGTLDTRAPNLKTQKLTGRSCKAV